MKTYLESGGWPPLGKYTCTFLENFKEIVELSVNITHYIDGSVYGLQIRLLDENFLHFLADGLDNFLWDRFFRLDLL
jgi:hypothetical protein